MDNFLKKVKKQMITDAVSLVCFILCIILVGISLLLLISKQYHFILLCLFGIVLFGGLIYYLRKKYNSKSGTRFEFDLDSNISFESIENKLDNSTEKAYSNNNCSVYSVKYKAYEYRFLLFNTNEFNRKQYYNARKNANKSFNKKYTIPAKQSIYNVSKQRFINIAFVNENSEALEKMLNIPADEYINRAAPLLSIAVVDNRLYIPYYVGYGFAESSMYYTLCKKVFELFSLNK